MFEFIERHQRLFIIIMASVIVVMLGILLWLGRGAGNITNNNNQNTGADNSLNYSYLQKYPDKADQNILLTAHIVAEEFGTYSQADLSTLNDVLSQSSDNFKPTVQNLITQVENSGGQQLTTIDPNSLQLNKQDNSATVIMTGTVASGNQSSQKQFTVDLVKQGSFWLINNITY